MAHISLPTWGKQQEPPRLWPFPEAAVFKIFSRPWLSPGPGVGLPNWLLSATLRIPSYVIQNGLPETFLLLGFSCLRFLLHHQDTSLRKQPRGLGRCAPEVSPSSSPQPVGITSLVASGLSPQTGFLKSGNGLASSQALAGRWMGSPWPPRPPAPAPLSPSTTEAELSQ